MAHIQPITLSTNLAKKRQISEQRFLCNLRSLDPFQKSEIQKIDSFSINRAHRHSLMVAPIFFILLQIPGHLISNMGGREPL